MAQEEVLKIAFYNNKFVKASEIKIDPNNLAIARGYAAFDFLRVVYSRPFYVQKYIERFMNTLDNMRLKISHSASELVKIIEDLIQKNGAGNYFIKLFALPESFAKLNANATLIIQAMKMEEPPSSGYDKGFALLLKEYQRFLPQAKSTNYFPSIYWHNEMQEKNATDILYHFNNEILECSRANIFMVRNNQVFTPSRGILEGITKSVVIDIIKSKGLVFQGRSIETEELWTADEVFITSTVKMVMSIIAIDGKQIANGKPGKISLNLLQLFKNHLVSYGETIVQKS